MATLSTVTRETRLTLKIGAVLLVLFLVLSFVFNGAKIIHDVFFPNPTPPPDIKFGKLTPVTPKLFGTPPTKYQISTIEGTLPNITTDRATVYGFKKPAVNILALQNAKQHVGKLGFGAPTKIDDSLYTWTNSNGDVLKYNILNSNFDITSSILANPAAIPLHAFTSNADVINKISGFLGNDGMSEDLSDIDFQNAVVSYFTVIGTNLTKVDKITDAQVARVNIYQNSIPVTPFSLAFNQESNTTQFDTLKIYYPEPNTSSLYFLITPALQGLAVAEAHFPHKIVDLTTHSTYPIKTSALAFEDLKHGNAIISNPENDDLVDITDVGFGYLVTPDNNYLYPIYIFSGKDNFVAYVVAIASSSIGE